MSGHTPGPWTIDCDGSGWYIEANNLLDTYLAKIRAPEECDDAFDDEFDDKKKYVCYDDNEAEANARLIAASPDLLDALREIYHAFLDADGTHTDRQEAASLKACAAIFKATGGIT